jgi:hypothetical protein
MKSAPRVNPPRWCILFLERDDALEAAGLRE